MIASNSGWVREVIKGDKKSIDSNKIRISYLPPKSLRCIRNRIFNTRQLTSFLESHCRNTSLSKENFSFSPRVFGLGLPGEVVRHAFTTKNKVKSLSDSGICQPMKNNKGSQQQEGVNYSPMQYAMPLKPKQNMPMPDRNNKQIKMSKPGFVNRTVREELKSKVQSRNAAAMNVGYSVSKDTQVVPITAKAIDSNLTKVDTPSQEVSEESHKMPTCSSGKPPIHVNEPSHVVKLAGPETMDLPEVEIIGFKSGENNNKLVNGRLMQEESKSYAALETFGSSSCPVEAEEGKLEGTISTASG